MIRSHFVNTISISLTILFLYTGISKVIDYDIEKQQLLLSPVLRPVASWIALLLPLIEVIVAVLLFLPKWRRLGLYSALLLLSIFSGYIITIFSFNQKIPCSCGGIIDFLSWKTHLILNFFLIAALIIAIYLIRSRVAAKNSLINS